MAFYIASCFIAFFVVSVEAQSDEGWFCDPQDLTLDYFQKFWRQGTEPNATRIAPAISRAEELWSEQLEGMSMSEIMEAIPQASREISASLWLFFPDKRDINHFALNRGLLQTENGTEILFELMKRPQVWADTISLGLKWFNWSCYSDYDFALVANILIYVEPLLSEEYRDELGDFLVGFTVQLANTYEAQAGVVNVLTPIIQTLKETGDASGVLSTLLSLASSEVVGVAFEEVIRGSGIQTNSENWGKLMSLFFDLIQTLLDFDDADFIDFVVQLMQDIVDQLQ
eukprot:TRINITY_DN2475_c0_g1_i1.p1 TRINITY_DN2475_c0_g1~~TRINITY_DN2475_c0_g1_i1.p1  ORF type:complete len:285 (+),score=37.92 TRINITY_DN2475_c0_g1_i1:124-978(+)